MENNQKAVKQIAKVVPGEKLELVVLVLVVAMEDDQMELKRLAYIVP